MPRPPPPTRLSARRRDHVPRTHGRPPRMNTCPMREPRPARERDAASPDKHRRNACGPPKCRTAPKSLHSMCRLLLIIRAPPAGVVANGFRGSSAPNQRDRVHRPAFLEPSRERCAVSLPSRIPRAVPGLLPAAEPANQNASYLIHRHPPADLSVVLPGQQVQGGDNVRVPIPPAMQAVKRVPVPVVLMDKPARRIGTHLTGERGVDRFKAGTSRPGPKLQPLAPDGTRPTRDDARPLAALRSAAQVGQILHRDHNGSVTQRLPHRLRLRLMEYAARKAIAWCCRRVTWQRARLGFAYLETRFDVLRAPMVVTAAREPEGASAELVKDWLASVPRWRRRRGARDGPWAAPVALQRSGWGRALLAGSAENP